MKETRRNKPTAQKPTPRPEEDKKAAEKLSKPPKDQREITIAPGRGPDVTLG